MNFLGIDVGAVSTKVVLVGGNGRCVHAIMGTGSNIERVVDMGVKEVMEKGGITSREVTGIVATGYGRVAVPFADKKVTEITCHTRGVRSLFPKVGTIIDIGGQDSKGIRVDEEGNVVDFVMNDKCAAGTGRFLEVMASALELRVDELGVLSLVSKSPCHINSVCTVFAESEVISLRAEGKAPEDIIAGTHRSIASRIASMIFQIGVHSLVVLTGGVAQNQGMVRALEDELSTPLHLPAHPQITGALGAALIAADEYIQ